MPNRFFIAALLFSSLFLTQSVFAQVEEADFMITPEMIQTGPNGEKFVEINGHTIPIIVGDQDVEINHSFESTSPPSFEPSPSTMLRAFQVLEEYHQEGRLLFGHIIENPESASEWAGLSEAQRLHFAAKMEEIEKRFEGSLLEKGPTEDSPEALIAWENNLVEFYSHGLDEMDASVRETLTPLQLQALREYDLVNPLAVEEITSFQSR